MTKPEGKFQCAERGTASPLASKVWEADGEYRNPIEGEWYIYNGARYKEARRAHEDLSSPEWIAKEVT